MTFAGACAFAEAPLWRTVKGSFAEFRINADSNIVQNSRLTFILKDRLKRAEREVGTSATVRKRDAEPRRQTQGQKETFEQSLHLLGMTRTAT
jgi:hypothetical protein